MLARPTAVLFFAAIPMLAGCTTTRFVPRDDVRAITRADRELRGRNVAINLMTGASERGRLDLLRSDSTAWISGLTRRVLPTSEVYSIVRNTRPAAAGRGALIGAGVFLGVGVLMWAADAPEEEQDPEGCGYSPVCLDFPHIRPPLAAIVVLAPLSGAMYGAGIGAATGGRTEYRLVE